MNVRITILSATQLEQQPLRDRFGDHYAGYDLTWIVGGMGAGATAVATLKIIENLQPNIIIQTGIAGTLSRDGVAVRDVVLVGSDYQADLGAWRNGTERHFEHFDTLSEAAVIECPYAEPLGEYLRIVSARSANSACSSLPIRAGEVLESMEGAAFFGICYAERVPFLQLRAISNHVDDLRGEWQVPRALEALVGGMDTLLGNLR